ncbi:MAG: hypothetical protein CL474_06755 [Acidobacteria bacterium]|nr:hypothetical protein [Acidobacteriota bacterium]
MPRLLQRRRQQVLDVSSPVSTGRLHPVVEIQDSLDREVVAPILTEGVGSKRKRRSVTRSS